MWCSGNVFSSLEQGQHLEVLGGKPPIQNAGDTGNAPPPPLPLRVYIECKISSQEESDICGTPGGRNKKIRKETKSGREILKRGRGEKNYYLQCSKYVF